MRMTPYEKYVFSTALEYARSYEEFRALPEEGDADTPDFRRYYYSACPCSDWDDTSGVTFEIFSAAVDKLLGQRARKRRVA